MQISQHPALLRVAYEALPSDDRRRPYRITAAGADCLAKHLETAQRVAATGLSRLELRPVS